MSKTFAVTFLIGLLVVGAGIWTVLYKQKGAHLDPKGSILKVRTLSLDENDSAGVMEIRLTNDADYELVVRDIEVVAETANGEVNGNVVAETDLQALFKNFPVLGDQYNPVLKTRAKVPPHSTIDREVCAQFTVPVDQLDHRRDMIVRIEDVTGPKAELHEKTH